MISEIASALAVFLILCGAAGAGCLVRPRLPEHHREKQTTELMHLVITMLVTFSGLALGLVPAPTPSCPAQPGIHDFLQPRQALNSLRNRAQNGNRQK